MISIRATLIKRITLVIFITFTCVVSSVAYLKLQTSATNLTNTENYIRSALISNGLTLVANNSQALHSMVLDNALTAVRKLVSATVLNNENIVYGVYMDVEKMAWSIADKGNPEGQLHGVIVLDDKASLWAASLTMAEYYLLTKDSDEIYEFAAPVIIEGEILGFIRYAFSTKNMQLELNKVKSLAEKDLLHTLYVISGLSLLALFFLFMATKFIATRVTLPLLELSEATARISSGDYATAIHIKSDNEIGVLSDSFESMRVQIKSSLDDLLEHQLKLSKKNEELWTAQHELKDLNLHLEEKVVERTDTLKEVQQQLLEAAHYSGMAEVATNVLHNLGNVLNSVNISNQQTHRLLLNSKVFAFKKTNLMLKENEDNMVDFLLNDERGKLLPGFYLLLNEALIKENTELVENTVRISKSVESISEIIRSQQEVAKKGMFVEELDVCDIVDEIINIQENMLLSHNVRIEKQFEDVPIFKGDRSKMHQVMNNIIANAKDAVLGNDIDKRIIDINIYADETKIVIKIKDNGEGIEKTALAEIFAHGYTTKKEGHGFGLHSCANYLTEMGGKISVESEGVGKGASFNIELDIK